MDVKKGNKTGTQALKEKERESATNRISFFVENEKDD